MGAIRVFSKFIALIFGFFFTKERERKKSVLNTSYMGILRMDNYNKREHISAEAMKRRTIFRIVTVLIIGGMLILTSVVLSVVSCKQELKLEEERKILQKSRDSLQQHLNAVPLILPESPDAFLDGDSSLYIRTFIF